MVLVTQIQVSALAKMASNLLIAPRKLSNLKMDILKLKIMMEQGQSGIVSHLKGASSILS